MASMDTEPREIIRHRLAHPKGGINLFDEDNLVMTAFKEFVGKVAKKIAKAQL